MPTLAQTWMDMGAKKSEEQLAQERQKINQERQKFNQERVRTIRELQKRKMDLVTIAEIMGVPLQELETMLPKDH